MKDLIQKRMTQVRRFIAAAALAVAGLTVLASPSYKAELTVSGYAGAEALADFPVLVKISPQTIAGFDYGQCLDGAADLSFVDANEEALNFEVDTWNPDGESLVWVRLPSLANNVTFAMRWGDSAPDAHTPSATWNANYGMVWHMGEENGTCANSTSHGSAYDAEPMKTPANSFRYTGTDAPVGFARTTATSAANSYLSIPSYDTLGFGGTFTMSGWVRLTGCTAYPRLFSRKKGYTDANGWEIEMTSGSFQKFGARGSSNPSYAGEFKSPGMKETWMHVALVYDGATLTVYGNGEMVKTGAINAATDNNLPLSIGCDSDGNETIAQGAFDECRLMDGVASADWVKAEYDTVKGEAFLTYGEAESMVVDPTLALGKPSVRKAAANAADINVMVRGIGEGASSVTIKFLSGESADALTLEQSAGTVTKAGSAVLTLHRLYPDHKYYAKVVATNNLGDSVESEVFEVVTPALKETSGFPGLNQTFFTSADKNWDKDYTTLPAGTDWLHYTDSDRIYRRELGTLAAYIGGNPKANSRTSVVWGDSVYWPVNGGQWVYWGTMFMDAGKVYKFRMKIDDNERVKVTDSHTGVETVLLNDVGNGGSIVTSGAFTPSVTGWHKIEIRMSDGSGGAGGYTTTDGYLNTENMGWSDDNGSTWKLMMDPGDGSLLRTEGAAVIAAKENVSGGALRSVTLTFQESDVARDLYVAYGPDYGANEVSGWQTTAKAATVSAGATSCTYSVPASWGTDENLAMRFYFIESDFPAWSNTIFWRDLSAPALDELTLDGRGGDTLVVKGGVVSFGGSSCTLKVLVGTSAGELTTVWEGLDGATRTRAGAYALTLFEGNTAAARYLKPGETYFVGVEATANGKTSRTGTAKVTMSEKAVFGTTASAVARRTVTFTGVLADVGMGGQSEVTLWVGDSADEGALVRSGEPIAVTSGGTFSFTHTFPAFETTYYWQFRAANVSAGKTANAEARTAVASCKTLDTTTYTWTGGDSGDWSDPSNWADNQSGDTLGYPNTSAATASFPANKKVTVRFTEPLTIGWMYLNAGGVDVTFAQGGESTNATMLTVASTFNFDGSKGRLTLDNVALKTPGVTVGTQSEVILTNAANWYSTGDFWADKFGSVRLYGDSTLNCNQLGLGGGDSVINDSTLWTRSNDFAGRNNKGGSMRFEGMHPLWWHNASGNSFYSNLADAGYRLDFVVPVGGFDAAVIRGPSNLSYYMGNNQGNPGSSAITVNVLDESPANRVDETITAQLISWPKGINKTMIVEGMLPDDGVGTDDAWVWGEGDYPATLDVMIVGSTHGNTLQITGAPETVPSEALSPAYGACEVGLGASQVCTAPSEAVQISDDKRATCTGWKLYVIDAETHERTLMDSGEGTRYTYVNDDGLWHELEWQWKVEYRITATSAGNGTVAVDEEWVETGKKARLSAEPADGYAFFKWTGDVELERDKTENLFFTVRNRPYALTANFLEAVMYDGSGELADYVAANAGKVILLPDGLYLVTKQVVVPGGTIVRGQNDGANAVVKSTVKFGTDVSAPCSVFKLAHADASLQNITITTDADRESLAKDASGNLYKEGRARGVWIEGAGLVDGCVISNCVPHYNGKGGAVYLNAGGVVRNTFVHNCRAYSSGGNDAKASAFYLEKGGLVETCEIRECGLPYNASSSATVALSGGTVRNTLIADSTQGHASGDGRPFGLYVTPADNYTCTIENCTIVGNYQLASSLAGVLFWDSNGTTKNVIFRNNIVWNNCNSTGVSNWQKHNASVVIRGSNNCTTPTMGGEGDITEDPSFADMAGKDYTLTYSGAVDSALELDWMGSVLSLDGKERVIGSAPDMGCYEYEPNGLVCGFTAETTGALGKDTITFRASVLGDTDGITYTWTLVDQDGFETQRSGVDLATLAIEMPVGRYTVTLGVRNGAGDEGSVTKPNIAEVFPSDVYVSTTGEGVYPYDSYAHGATSVATALGCAADGTVIHLDDGAYYEADTLTITKAVKLVSKSGPESTSVFAAAQASGNPMITLSNPNAVVSGIAVDGLGPDGKSRAQWSGVLMTADGGTLTNCIVRNNTTVSISVNGSGCRLEGGAIIDCIFSNNWTACSGGAGFKGGAIYQTGADTLVDRCIIASNQVSTGGTSYGGGVYLNNGTIRNSLVIGNYSCNYGGGIAVEGSGVVRNCTVVKNTASSGVGGIWQNGGTVTGCLVWKNVANGRDEDVDDPGFKDGENGDFHLSSASAAVDACDDSTGLGALDLDRKPRVSGDAADKGCYEYDQSQFSISIGYEKLTPFAPGTVRFYAKATPKGTTLDENQTWWTFDGTEPSADNFAAKGATIERAVDPSLVTVRFKTIYKGEAYSLDRVEWFTFYGEHVYVRKDAVNPVYPYATPETAADNYETAAACLQKNGTLHVGPGTWKVTKTQVLSDPVTVVSDEGPSKTVLDMFNNSITATAFEITHADAKVIGLGFANALGWNAGGAVKMSAGVVTNCIFTNCFSANGAQGGAVYMTGGLLVDSVADGCGTKRYNDGTAVKHGVVLAALGSAVVDRCHIRNSQNIYSGSKSKYSADGVVALGNDAKSTGIIRNSLITGSKVDGCGGIVAWGSSAIENCTIMDNETTNSTCAAGLAISNTTVSVVNTIVYGNTTKGVASEIGGVAGYADCFNSCLIGVDPMLRGTGKWAYRPTGGSPCIDAGRKLNWMDGAKDVYGQPRIQGVGYGKKPDIGAAEHRPSGFGVFVR